MTSRRDGLLIGGAFVTFAVSAALMHSYAVFLVAFLEEFRWSRAETSLAYSVSAFVSGASAPFVGALVDRLGPRRLVLLGGGVLALGLLGSAHVGALWQLIVLYGVLMTVGANCLGLVVFVPMLSHRFVSNRGMVIAIVQSANGFARAVSAPVAQILISTIGWRHAYLAQAALMGALVWPLAALFPRDEAPARVAPSSPSRAGEGATGGRPARPDWTLAEAIATPHFWLLFTVYLCTGLGSFFVSLHQLAFAVDAGFDKLYAASVLGLGALLSVAGVIVTGTLSDYIGRELSAVLAYVVSIIGVVCALFITGPDHAWLLWIHACFFGLTWGARGPSVTAKTADLFPGPNLGAILGVITVGTGIGSAVGAWGAGWIFDMSGSYRLAFVASIVSYLIGCAAFWALRRPPTRQVV
jgi:MFS family permease